MNENIWRRAEKDIARRERRRLIRNRTITPAPFMRPQLMVKNGDGSWSPHINTYAR